MPFSLKRSPFLVFAVVAVVLLGLVGSAAAASWAIMVKHSEAPVIRSLTNALPIPAARLGATTIYYRDFLKARDTLRVFLASPAAKDQPGLPQAMDATLEQNVLDKLLNQAALEELARQKNVSISDTELRQYFTDVISAASSTTPDVGVYLLQNYGWSEEDFRQNVLKPALLEEKLGVEMQKENNGDASALATYLDKRMKQKDVVKYLRPEPLERLHRTLKAQPGFGEECRRPTGRAGRAHPVGLTP